MGLNEQDKSSLSGYITFNVLNPDARPLTKPLVRDMVRAFTEHNDKVKKDCFFVLPERVPLAEFWRDRPYQFYKYFADEFGCSLCTNVDKKGLQEGDVISVHITHKQDRKRLVNLVHCFVLNREASNVFKAENPDLPVGICSSTEGRMSLMIINPPTIK